MTDISTQEQRIRNPLELLKTSQNSVERTGLLLGILVILITLLEFVLCLIELTISKHSTIEWPTIAFQVFVIVAIVSSWRK